MADLYATLWLITGAYAAPLGYYGDAAGCQSVADTLSFAPPAQVVCVPSDVAMPLTFTYGQQPIVAAPQIAGSPPAAAADISTVSLEGEPFIGDADAPVVMAYWFDYQCPCPFCKQAEELVFPQLIAEYVETGKVKIVFKDFQFLGPDSQAAGLAAQAVWETAPDKFAEWHKGVFDRQDDENAGWGKMEDLMSLIESIDGIDASTVESLVTSQAVAYQQEMQVDAQEGYAVGVGGTPSFLVGTQMLVGVQPYQQFKAVIDGELSGG